MKYSRHGTSEQLELYVLGRLDPGDSEKLEDHFLVCEACRKQADQMHHFALGMREALREEPVRQEKPVTDWLGWLRQPSFAFAMGFTLVLFMILGVVYSRSGSREILPAASIQLSATRGEKTGTPRAKQLDITLLDAPSGGGPYKVELVDGTGRNMWTGTGQPAAEGTRVTIPAASAEPADYFLRLYGPDGTLIHEYGLRIAK